MPDIFSCDFEVHGIVQGVSFRMCDVDIAGGVLQLLLSRCVKIMSHVLQYTERQAKSLGVRGWCMNTPYDTVKGQIEGTPETFEQMKEWLKKTGSPTSRIDKADFSGTRKLQEFTFSNFTIRH